MCFVWFLVGISKGRGFGVEVAGMFSSRILGCRACVWVWLFGMV